MEIKLNYFLTILAKVSIVELNTLELGKFLPAEMGIMPFFLTPTKAGKRSLIRRVLLFGRNWTAVIV
jgi:hypothetical protein